MAKGILLMMLFLVMTPASWANSRRVAVLYWSSNIEGQVAMRKGLEAAAEKYNKKATLQKRIELEPFVAGDGRAGIENQISQFAQALKAKPAVIVVQPTDNAALAEKLAEANRMKIPVVAFDQYIVGGELHTYVTSDNFQAGRLNAEYIMSLFPRHRKIRIVVFEYPRVSSTTDRVDGFFDTLRRQEQDFQVLKRYEAVEPVGGKKAAREFLKDFPQKSSVDVIFTVNDGGGLAIVQELLTAGRTEIKHATVDGDPKSIKNVLDKKITVIDSAQFCGEIGRQSFQVAAEILDGKTAPKRILVPTFPITEKTASRYPGWLGEMPPPFRKTWIKGKYFWQNKIHRYYGSPQ